MWEILLVFLLSSVQNWIATIEISKIAQGQARSAAIWATVSSLTSFLLLVVIVVDYNRWRLVLPYALGDALGTYLAIKRERKP